MQCQKNASRPPCQRALNPNPLLHGSGTRGFSILFFHVVLDELLQLTNLLEQQHASQETSEADSSHSAASFILYCVAYRDPLVNISGDEGRRAPRSVVRCSCTK